MVIQNIKKKYQYVWGFDDNVENRYANYKQEHFAVFRKPPSTTDLVCYDKAKEVKSALVQAQRKKYGPGLLEFCYFDQNTGCMIELSASPAQAQARLHARQSFYFGFGRTELVDGKVHWDAPVLNPGN